MTGAVNSYLLTATTSGGSISLRGSNDSLTTIPADNYRNTAAQNDGGYFGYQGIALGSDDTPPSYNSNKIIAPLINGELTYSNNSVATSGCTVVYTQSATNKGTTDITVKEIGVFAADSKTSTTYSQILLTRNNINVTIKPGETKTFTIAINFNKFSDAYSST